MNKKLIYKMVQNCLKQYNEDSHSITFESREFAEIFNKVIKEKNKEAAAGIWLQLLSYKIRQYKFLNVNNCLAPAPTPSRSQANPPKKAKNAFPGGSSCACRGWARRFRFSYF
ncbi:YqzH family protein [Bacillus sp. NTK034]|uniref:YqzH family protein n=1 Tax=Bacillus sp. NTK034 TaxID=2802176 RepID=UPI001FCF8545|nr:YqzH family protein [Bacillus sp. NTK034]